MSSRDKARARCTRSPPQGTRLPHLTSDVCHLRNTGESIARRQRRALAQYGAARPRAARRAPGCGRGILTNRGPAGHSQDPPSARCRRGNFAVNGLPAGNDGGRAAPPSARDSFGARLEVARPRPGRTPTSTRRPASRPAPSWCSPKTNAKRCRPCAVRGLRQRLAPDDLAVAQSLALARVRPLRD